MWHRILAASAAAILPALLFTASAPSDAALSGVTVAVGTISSPGGAAMPGVRVDLYTWPADTVLSTMRPGQAVPRTLLATAITGSVGGYALQVPPASLSKAAAKTGYANLEIDTAAGIRLFTYQPDPSAKQPSAPVTVNLVRGTSAICGSYPDGTPYRFTGFRLQRARANAWAVVGQGYIIPQRQTRGDSLTFEYTEGSSHAQDSAMGAGISGYGFNAGYTSAGTHASTATNAEGYAPEHGNTWFRTLFKTGQFRGMCIGIAGTNVHRVRQHGQCPRKVGRAPVHKCLWMIHSQGWFGGQSTLHPKKAPHTSRKFCAPHDPGDKFDGDHGSAVEWSQGFELGAALGIKGASLKASFNGSAHTGYDANAVMSFRFHHKGLLCGTNGSEATAAILVQRANKPR
jgi:hypothetical protein